MNDAPQGPRAVTAPELKAQIEAEREGRPFLVYRDGDGGQRIVPIAPGATEVGRATPADPELRIDWDEEVSGLHAQIEVVREECTLVDDGLSRNGGGRGGRARAPRSARIRAEATQRRAPRVLAAPHPESRAGPGLTTQSEKLTAAAKHQIVAHHLTRNFMLDGADGTAPGRVPPHCSFGGEGTPYNERLLPTVATISAPAGLYDPVFGLGSITAFRRQRRQGAPTCEP